MNTSLTGEETITLDSIEVHGVNCAATGFSVPLSSEEVAWQIEAALDPLTKLLKKPCYLMIELRRNKERRMKVPLPQQNVSPDHLATGTACD